MNIKRIFKISTRFARAYLKPNQFIFLLWLMDHQSFFIEVQYGRRDCSYRRPLPILLQEVRNDNISQSVYKIKVKWGNFGKNIVFVA